MRQTGERFTFDSPYDQYAERRGQEATVIGMVDDPDYDHDECGPMYRVRFDDGAEIQAWPEEVEYDAAGDSWVHSAREAVKP